VGGAREKNLRCATSGVLQNRGGTELQHAGGIPEATTVESHGADGFLDLREAPGVSGLQHAGTVRTMRLLAVVALGAGLGAAALDALSTGTIGARHGPEYPGHLLSRVASPWHTSQGKYSSATRPQLAFSG
jgi:hypothetical protein